MTSDDRRAEQYAQLMREQEALLTRQGRARELANIAMLPLQSLNATAAEQTKTSGAQYLVFWLNKREFAVKAGQLQSVERLTQVTSIPNVASWIRGVMNLRGSIVSVVDLKAFLDLEPTSIGVQTRLLALQAGEMVISFIVDGVNEMLSLAPESIIDKQASLPLTPQWIAPYTSGCISLYDRVIVLLDVERLLFSDKIQRF